MENTYGTSFGTDPFRARVLPGHPQEKNTTDLNVLVEQVLQDLCPASLHSVIRCDELPVIQASRDKMIRTLEYILGFILAHPPARATLFLHLRCEPVATDFIDMKMAKGEKIFRILIHSNCTADPSDLPEDRKNFCAAILSEIRGRMILNTGSGTGWLFNLEVPGKLK